MNLRLSVGVGMTAILLRTGRNRTPDAFLAALSTLTAPALSNPPIDHAMADPQPDAALRRLHARLEQKTKKARQLDQPHTMALRTLTAGVSEREMGKVHLESPNVSESSVSRPWIQAGGKMIEELRSHDMAWSDWPVPTPDGVVLREGQTAMVAIGG